MGVTVGRAMGAWSVLELPLALDDERSLPFFFRKQAARAGSAFRSAAETNRGIPWVGLSKNDDYLVDNGS